MAAGAAAIQPGEEIAAGVTLATGSRRRRTPETEYPADPPEFSERGSCCLVVSAPALEPSCHPPGLMARVRSVVRFPI